MHSLAAEIICWRKESIMNIIAADDEPLALRSLVKAIKEAQPDANIEEFTEPESVVEYAKEHQVDVAFLDIEMGTMTGIEVAKKLKVQYPKINIIFVTAYDKYMAEAIQLRMSGYVTKPATKEKILIELEDLKHPVTVINNNVLTVRCFGNFEVFVNGKIVEFDKAKTKEMLAYLVDRRGSRVTTGELRSVLWEDVDTDANTRSYLSKIKKDLVTTLKKYDLKDVFIETRKGYAVDTELISCDYYDFVDDKPEGVRAYNGEYMSQYSWGELRHF